MADIDVKFMSLTRDDAKKIGLKIKDKKNQKVKKTTTKKKK